MKNMITPKAAGILLIVLFTVVTCYHVAALAGAIPIDMVWGGRLKTRGELIQFETVSLIINLLMTAVVLGKLRLLKLPGLFVTVSLWLMFILFALNTVGNLFAENRMETLLFAPLTFLSALLSLRLALDRN